ncbi:uncharacterized protein LOC144716698 [Wolffia australiana]
MDRRRSGRDAFFGFGDPFSAFGGLRPSGSLISNFFGGRDPFDDPFFTQPFGGMTNPSIFGQNIFSGRGNPFGNSLFGGFLEDQPPRPKNTRGPIIEELLSDEDQQPEANDSQKKENARKRAISGKESYVEEPDEVANGKKIKPVHQVKGNKGASSSNSQSQSYSFHSSTVTYGGPGGAYYTSSTTRRAGGDGVIVEESKEADTTTGKATHRISRGLGYKGHSVTRKLNSDGRVDTVQTLHNMNQEDLAGFEDAWKGNTGRRLQGWNTNSRMLGDGRRGQM